MHGTGGRTQRGKEPADGKEANAGTGESLDDAPMTIEANGGISCGISDMSVTLKAEKWPEPDLPAERQTVRRSQAGGLCRIGVS